MLHKETLRGRFLRTGFLMLILSLVMGVIITAVVLALFVVQVPQGGDLILKLFHSMFDGEVVGQARGAPYLVLFGLLLCLSVAVVCILLTTRLASAISGPLKTLKRAADNIREGTLDFEVLSCEYRELDELCLAFESARKRLKASAEADAAAQEVRGLLMANLSHDLRTPITVIKGYLEGLQDGIANTPEKQAHYSDIIYAKTLVLERLVQNMTDFSEYELGRMQYQFEYVEMSAYLRDLAQGYREDAQLNGLQFEEKIPDGPFVAVADRSKFKRVLDNLISNGIKYNESGGTLCLAAEPYESGVVIQVSDNGKGIGGEALHHVFDSFYREDKARSSAVPGSGLGLAICRSIVSSHRGKIWLTSEEGEGTRAFVYLPLVKGGKQ